MNRVVGAVLRTLGDDLPPGRSGAGRGLLAEPGAVAELVRGADPLLSAAAVDEAVADVRAGLDGLGPIAALLADESVTDILVNGPGPVWADRGRGAERTGLVVDERQLTRLIERVLAPLGRRVDPVHPVVDARLADGSRVHVVVPPVAVDGPCLAIRRFAARPIPLDSLATPAVAAVLRWAVRARCNVVVVGGTGSGKTTLLNALAAEIDPSERIVTVEDAAELRLPAPHVVRLETRTGSAEGTPPVSARDLVRCALRMRPDRVLLGEVRGSEALDLVQAMNTGHDGSLSTVHANGGDDALRRLETLVLLAAVGLPLDAVREHLAAAVDLLVHLVRHADGRREVVEVAEVVPPPVGPGPRVRPLAIGGRVVGEPARPARGHGATAVDR